MSTTPDLDAFLTEALGERKTFRLYGRDWTLTPEMPSLLMLRLQRDLSSEDDTLNTDGQLTLLKAMFDPPEQVDDMVALGMGWSALMVVTQVAMGLLSGRSAEDVLADLRTVQQASQGEAQGPTPAPTSSVSTGRSSKRTSARSTG